MCDGLVMVTKISLDGCCHFLSPRKLTEMKVVTRRLNTSNNTSKHQVVLFLYRINFTVVIPTNFEDTLHVSSITVDVRPLELKVPSSVTVAIDSKFTLEVTLIDSDTKQQIQDVYWKVN